MNEESPMENLTLSMKIAKPHTIDPLEGHTVVIFETVGDAGEEFRFEIEPGQALPQTKRTLFEVLRGRKPPNYFAYAVTGMPELRWTFTTDVTLDIQAHSFTLLVTLAYSVSEPRQLVTRRNDDPIRQVRNYINGLLARHFAQRTWSEIRHDFRDVEREVVAATVGLVQQFGAYFGLRIHDLTLSHRLQDKDFADILEEEAAQRAKVREELIGQVARTSAAEMAQTEKLKTELSHQHTLKVTANEHDLEKLRLDQQLDRSPQQALLEAQRRNGRLDDAYVDVTIKVMNTASEAIHTPADLLATINDLRSAAGQVRELGSGAAPARGLLSQHSSNSQNGAAAVIGEMLIESERMRLDLTSKQKLQSTILHLIAELLLDGDGDQAALGTYAERIDDFRHDPKLAMEHSDYLKKFVNCDILRDALR